MQRHHPHSLTISKRGLQFIRKWEELRLVAYPDPTGTWTVGYGHTETVFAGMKITEAQAESLLRTDLFRVEKAIRDLVSVPLAQGEYDALCSFIFNVGVNAFASSTLRKKLNDMDYQAAADQFLRWVHSKGKRLQGLENRRRDERLLFAGHGGGV